MRRVLITGRWTYFVKEINKFTGNVVGYSTYVHRDEEDGDEAFHSAILEVDDNEYKKVYYLQDENKS